MLTAFDVGFGILVLISAILAAARGLTREILSLATWAGSAGIAAYAYIYHGNIAKQYIQADEWVLAVATIGVTFLVSLIVLHLLTMRIADLVTDSRIGPVDRVLGFVFGVARGVLIGIVAVLFMEFLMAPNLPAWAAQSRSLTYLQSWGHSLIVMLPEDAEKLITDILQRGAGGLEDPTDAPIEEGVPPASDAAPGAAPAEPAGATPTPPATI